MTIIKGSMISSGLDERERAFSRYIMNDLESLMVQQRLKGDVIIESSNLI